MHRTKYEKGNEGVHARFLGIVDVEGGHGHGQGSHNPHAHAEKTATKEKEQRDGQGANQDGEETNRYGTGANDEDPDMQEQIIDRGMDINGGTSEHRGDVGGGEIDAPTLIPPERLEIEPDRAQDESQQSKR